MKNGTRDVGSKATYPMINRKKRGMEGPEKMDVGERVGLRYLRFASNIAWIP